MIESCKRVKPWRDSVAYAAVMAMDGKPPLAGPLACTMLFTLPRPASVSPKRRPYPLVKPDLSKLVRSTEDALTGIAYQDDAQLCSLVVTKGYATATTPIGVIIRIEAYPPRVHGDE